MENQTETAKPRQREGVKYWLILNLGIFLLSFSVAVFSAPSHFALGGMGGLSIVLAKYIQPYVSWLTQPVILAILNVILLVIGLIFLGKQMTIKTIYCTVAYTLEVYLIDLLFGLMKVSLPLEGSLILQLCYAVLLSGAAHAIVFNCHASTGGTDIIALIVKKHVDINIGVALFASDILVACLSFWTFGVEIGLLSLLGLFAKTFVVDGVIENITKTKYVTIITEKPEVASKMILENLHRGFTKMDGIGGYTGEKRTIIITVCSRAQALRLKTEMHKEDPASFVIITDANEILGKGFSAKI